MSNPNYGTTELPLRMFQCRVTLAAIFLLGALIFLVENLAVSLCKVYLSLWKTKFTPWKNE